MAGTVILTDECVIPFEVNCFEAFRRWVFSEGFPESGRIDFLNGSIEVDMSPEEFFLHGTLKTRMIAVLMQLVDERDLGYVVSDRTRVTCPDVELSTEPDIVFISKTSLSARRVKLVPSAGQGADRFVEVEGPPDLVVEIVSDSSVSKDTRRLPAAHYRAGVCEYWLADARGTDIQFTIYHRGDDAYAPAEPDADGFQVSPLFDSRFRLTRSRDDQGYWKYDLETA